VVHVRPGGSRDGVDGEYDGVLAVRVSAAAQGGRANKAVCQVLSRAFGVRGSDVEIVSGATGRRKRIAIAGDEADLAARLAELRAGRDERPGAARK
jgi:uncharacterized protein (TIGR00251 family)